MGAAAALVAMTGGRAPNVLPPRPTRDQLCTVDCSYQGLTLVHGGREWRWFEPALGWPTFDTAHEAIFDMKAAAGDTHFVLAVSSQYDEPNQTYAGIPGRDYSNDLGALRALITETIVAGVSRGRPNGFMIVLAMAGDGMGPDPVGLTWGFDWLMANFERIWKALRGDGGEGPDLTPWIVPVPGFDGVVPGWQPWGLVNQYVRMARQVVGPRAALALWLASGYCVWSGESNDWATPDGQMFDVILQEGPFPMAPPTPIPDHLLVGDRWSPAATNADRAPWDQVWQMVGRMVNDYHRPADQPANDDVPAAPFLLAGGTPRGPFFYVFIEYDTFGWVRDTPLVQVLLHRRTLFALGCPLVG